MLGACSFSAELPPVPAPTVTVGFEMTASNADEKSSVHEIKIVLSEVSDQDVSVKYQVIETSAQPGDFTLPTPELITIPAGQMSTLLAVEVKADTVEEPDETIDFVLVEPENALLATDRHRVTILAKALPRVGFMAATSMAQEPTDDMVMITLDETSEFSITVDYTVTSTSATAGTDYMLANGTVTFAAGDLTKQIVLDVLDDQLDEDDETVTITLENPTNAFVDMTKADHVHTILDTLVDPPPSVEFQAATSTFAESGAAQNIVVVLSEPSGRTVTVPYAIDAAMSNAGSADVTVTAGPLMIPAGTTTANIAVTILQDTADEPTETVEVDLGTPTNATLATPSTHRLSITDDDLVCYGPPNSGFDVCLDTAPANTVPVSGTINTDTSNLCSTATIDFGPGQDPACFIVGGTVNVGATTVTGSRRLVIVAATMISISAMLDGSSKVGGNSGPGSNSASCGNGTNPEPDSNGGGGGAGGSFMSRGGNGGDGDNGDATGGTSAPADTVTPTKLRGGCGGQKGGNGGGGAGGRGGGAIYLVSGDDIEFVMNGGVNVSGAGGGGGGTDDGGGGGGSGGMLQIYAAGTLSVTNSTKLVANGGGGGGGGSPGSSGSPGSDPDPLNETTAAGGGSGGSTGGSGFAGSSNATGGGPGNSNNGGGGGGGGGGLIVTNQGLGNADVSAGVIDLP